MLCQYILFFVNKLRKLSCTTPAGEHERIHVLDSLIEVLLGLHGTGSEGRGAAEHWRAPGEAWLMCPHEFQKSLVKLGS